ncbi:MAG: SRPBCC domain-containing protein [Candidatus Thermoplasmatota archaeon]|jgi:uncharacterized protein YndB with AHSA1/START domain|nr:SRPBCC domain-containing protein [Candidatus Thermoplasmatota archaeon]
MPKITKSVEINTPRENVFDFISRLDSNEYARLNLIEMKVEKVTKGKTEKGAVFRFSNKIPGTSKHTVHDSEMVEWDPPRKFTMKVKNGPLEGTILEYILDERGVGKTRFAGVVNLVTKGEVEGMAEKDVFQLMDRQWDEFVKRLKSYLENHQEVKK